MSAAKPSSRLNLQGQERAHELHVVRGQQLADLAAAAEVPGRPELAACVAGVGHRLDQRGPVGKPRPADCDLEDAVGDGRSCDARGHGRHPSPLAACIVPMGVFRRLRRWRRDVVGQLLRQVQRLRLQAVDLLREVVDALRERQQVLVLLVLLLNRFPLVRRQHLALRVGAVLRDHHERRQEDRLERDDHRQQAERILLDAEDDPHREPDDVDVDEEHRAGELRDLVGDAVLHALRALFGEFHQDWVRHAEQRSAAARGATARSPPRRTAASRSPRGRRTRPSRRPGRRGSRPRS